MLVSVLASFGASCSLSWLQSFLRQAIKQQLQRAAQRTKDKEGRPSFKSGGGSSSAARGYTGFEPEGDFLDKDGGKKNKKNNRSRSQGWWSNPRDHAAPGSGESFPEDPPIPTAMSTLLYDVLFGDLDDDDDDDDDDDELFHDARVCILLRLFVRICLLKISQFCHFLYFHLILVRHYSLFCSCLPQLPMGLSFSRFRWQGDNSFGGGQEHRMSSVSSGASHQRSQQPQPRNQRLLSRSKSTSKSVNRYNGPSSPLSAPSSAAAAVTAQHVNYHQARSHREEETAEQGLEDGDSLEPEQPVLRRGNSGAYSEDYRRIA